MGARSDSAGPILGRRRHAAARSARTATTLLVLLVALTLPSDSHGLPPGRFAFATYGTAQGLENLAIEDVAQDAAGFLWVATQDGLFRWDGRRFKRFGVEDGLPTAWTTRLLTGSQGQVWVGTRLGLARRVGDRFESPSPDLLPRARVDGLARDANGNLVVALPDGLFAETAAGFRRVPGWPSPGATALFSRGARGNALYAAWGTTVGRRSSHGDWAFLATGLPTGERIDALALDGDGRLWVSSLLHVLSRGEEELAFRDETPAGARIDNSMDGSFLTVDRAGHVWIATTTGLLERRDGAWRPLGPAQGLPPGSAQGAFQDAEGSLWIWQLGVGLHRVLGRGLWQSWSGRQGGLPSDVVWNILRDRSGGLWVGTSNGLVRGTDEAWRTVPGTEGLAVRALAQAPDGALWLGCAPALVLRFDPATGALRRFAEADGVIGRKVLAVYVDGAGGVWAGTLEGGLLVKTADSQRFTAAGVPSPVGVVTEDSTGRLWAAGTGAGLEVKTPSGWRRFGVADGLLDDRVLNARATPHGDLWISYIQGLAVSRVRLGDDGGLRILEQRDEDSGDAAGHTYFLGLDSAERLWRGTGRGIDVLGPDGPEHFDTNDGLAGNDCDFNAFWADPGGDVYVGTSRGLSRYRNPDRLPPLPPPRTVVLDARAGDRPLAADARDRSLPREDNSLRVRFAGLSFAGEGRLEYQVRLTGLESAWAATESREARYPALPPGRYVFEARTRIRGAAWGPPAHLDFAILPAWWETWTARCLEWLLGAALVFGAFRWRVRQLVKRRADLEKIVAARTAELEAANRELQRLSTSDGLTGLANRRAFDEWLDREWRRARREGRELGLILLDIDSFKPFNDTYGHLAGDECLRRIAVVLAGLARRPGDLAARYGGEEFALVLPGSGVDAARALAEKLRRLVTGLAIPHRSSTVADIVTVSAGIAAARATSSQRPEALVAAADEALYRAKARGRNRIETAPTKRTRTAS